MGCRPCETQPRTASVEEGTAAQAAAGGSGTYLGTARPATAAATTTSLCVGTGACFSVCAWWLGLGTLVAGRLFLVVWGRPNLVDGLLDLLHLHFLAYAGPLGMHAIPLSPDLVELLLRALRPGQMCAHVCMSLCVRARASR